MNVAGSSARKTHGPAHFLKATCSNASGELGAGQNGLVQGTSLGVAPSLLGATHPNRRRRPQMSLVRIKAEISSHAHPSSKLELLVGAALVVGWAPIIWPAGRRPAEGAAAPRSAAGRLQWIGLRARVESPRGRPLAPTGWPLVIERAAEFCAPNRRQVTMCWPDKEAG